MINNNLFITIIISIIRYVGEVDDCEKYMNTDSKVVIYEY